MSNGVPDEATRGSVSARVTAAGRRHRCPVCGSRDVARIQYGMPAMDEGWRKKLDAGEWAIGGCIVFEDRPDFECNACGMQFRRDGRTRARVPASIRQ